MKKKLKQYEVLKWASLFLKKYHAEQKIAEILLQHHLNVSKTQFYMNMREDIPDNVVEKFKEDVQKHIEIGIPVQHLTGYDYFYGRRFTVNEHVLIPRQETEELVEQTINIAKSKYNNEEITVVDVGTGSGVIAITLALEIPLATVYATDISAKALQVAKKNAEHLKAKVNFVQGDFLQPITEKAINVDIIVSNPPYIAKYDEPMLSRTVKNFDPHIALFAEENGLEAYKRIMKNVCSVVNERGVILFEIGYKQGCAVSSIMREYCKHVDVSVQQDINGKDRIVIGQLP